MEEEVPNEGSERDTLALTLVAAECRPTGGRGEAALSCSHTSPLIGDIGSSRQNFSEFCLSLFAVTQPLQSAISAVLARTLANSASLPLFSHTTPLSAISAVLARTLANSASLPLFSHTTPLSAISAVLAKTLANS